MLKGEGGGGTSFLLCVGDVILSGGTLKGRRGERSDFFSSSLHEGGDTGSLYVLRTRKKRGAFWGKRGRSFGEEKGPVLRFPPEGKRTSLRSGKGRGKRAPLLLGAGRRGSARITMKERGEFLLKRV